MVTIVFSQNILIKTVRTLYLLSLLSTMKINQNKNILKASDSSERDPV